MTASALFIPSQPPRSATWQPWWRGLYGQRMRNVLHEVAEPAFDVFHVRTRFLQIRMHLVSSPDMIGHVLLDNAANYARPDIARKLLRPMLGNGLLNAEGEEWRLQRKLVAPTFSPGAVTGMTQLMAQESERQCAAFPPASAVVDMAARATNATMRIIAGGLFSGDRRLLSPEAAIHIERLVKAAGQPRFLRMLGLEGLDWSPHMIAVRASRRYLRGTLTAIVDERGPDGGGDDFFGGLIRSLYANMPPAQARATAIDNAITFYVAGHETTAVALAWAAYLFAAQPALQEALRTEAIAALAGDIATLPDRLPRLKLFLDETMRLYPPVAQIVREALADDDMCGVPVRKGEVVLIYPWLVHRHRKLWDNPDAFDMERFAEPNRATLHRFQYFPFGAGPRICVGARFATVEALIILAHWLAARRFRLTGDAPPLPTGTVTLRPDRGMPLLVEPLN
ncbi:MAG: cytochrome P450 [Sphingobium sp.]|nr:cytochrome P450 [Sphingobium sp.]